MCRFAKIPKDEFHLLRHTLATILANTPGTDLKTLQELLGHSDIRQTMRYNNTRDSQQVVAVNALDKIFGSNGEGTEQEGVCSD